MRAWCPRCDAVRPGETTCPTCGTPLADLEDAAQPDAPLPPPPATDAPAEPAGPSRLRIALVAATLVVAGLAFVAGRSAARSAATPAATAAPATSTTAPEPGADVRELGWSARAGRVTVTAVSASHVMVDERETVARIVFRVDGLPPGQRVLALRGLRLLDSGGGTFSSLEQRQLGSEGGAPVAPGDGDPGTFTLLTGRAPRLSSLARIELAALVVDRPRDQIVELDTAGPWPAGRTLRAVDPGPRDTVRIDPGFVVTDQQPKLELRVAAAFVGGGRAVVLIDASSRFASGGFPGPVLPMSAELRTGNRVLCHRTAVLGDQVNQHETDSGLVLACPTRPTSRLTVAVGAGVKAIDLDATLRP